MAALIAVGGLGLTSDGSVAWSAEPSGEAPSSFQSSNSNPVERVAPAPTPRWPRNWESPNGVTFRLRGRVDTDVISSAQSPANETTFGDMGDVVGLRRARIGAEGKLGDDRRYIAEIDLASGFVVPRDVYLSFGNLQERGEFRAGHLREPFSFEGGTSARYFAFMERAPVNLLDPARNRGLGFFRENLGADASLGLGVFHAGSDAGDFQGGDRSTVGFTGRLTTAPHYEQNGKRLFHLGLALSERVPERGIIIINQQPLSPLLDLGDSSTTPFVPAIRIPASFQQLPNLQFAATRGSLWTQAEWYGTLIDQTGGGLVFFRGCHLDCGYFITGEHRAYEATNGTLGDSRQSPVIARPGFT